MNEAPRYDDDARGRRAAATVQAEPRTGKWLRAKGPGIAKVALLAVVATVVATVVGRFVPLLGPPIIGIALGMVVQALRPTGERDAAGIAFSAKYVLQAAVVALGLGLSLGALYTTGVDTFPVMIGTLLVALLAAVLLARLLGIDRELATLIGAGTAICGGSAIAATSSVLSARKQSVVYAMSTIFVFNALAVVVFPLIGNAIGLSSHGFGVWAGTAINDTSSVVAAAYSVSEEAGDTSVVVKLARTTMIIPMTFGLAAWQLVRARKAAADGVSGVSVRRIFPWFIVWFCLASVANTVGLVPAAAEPAIDTVCLFFITMALTAVGLSAKFREMMQTGPRPLVFGGVLWLCVAAASLVLQRLLGTW